MLTQYRITLACLILSLGASAQASKPLNDEDMPPQNTKVRQSGLTDTQRAELNKRLFWLFEKNPTLPESTMTRLIKEAYEAAGVPYEEPKAQSEGYITGCFQ